MIPPEPGARLHPAYNPQRMRLTAGTRIGAYEILAPLGEGGMGQVYRARDTRLGRDVAIKILPDAFVGDAERVARFEREARALASLNHPNIAAIYGIEADTALVMELVDGEDLSRRLARGRVPLDDVLAIARQIAEAVEAAHEQGIIHRDLKPANVIVRSDGTVKVIDFGLAKSAAVDGRVGTDPADSPTITASPSERGVILGTAAYMSPEQARGRPVDKRADIWSFGVVVYEMLTGARAFRGEGLSDLLAAVVNHEIDWTRLPPATPARLRAVLERCLESDPKLRLRDIGEARVVITSIERGGAEDASAHGPRPTARGSRRERAAWIVASLAIVLASGLAAWLWLGSRRGSTPARSEVVRLSVMPPSGLVVHPDSSNLALSPNGRMVAFIVGAGVSAENQLWVRSLDAPMARRIESGDGVSLPFWSPDSTQIGFFAGRTLKTVPASGGPAHVLCDAPFGRGAAWGSAGVIVFAPDADGPLHRVSTAGGDSAPFTTLDATRQETSHRFPVFLPDGDHFLFATMAGVDGQHEIFAGSLRDPGVKKRVGTMESAPAYAAPGWLLFTRQGVLVAQAFDARALEIRGEIVSLGDEPRVAPGSAAYGAGRRVSASDTGSLAFIPDPAENTLLEWRASSGKPVGSVSVPAGRYSAVSIAPDGTRAALVRRNAAAAPTVWLVDLTRATAVPIGGTVAGVGAPVWSPDSQRIAYVESQEGQRQLTERTVVGASGSRRIAPLVGNSALVRSWSHGYFFINQIDPGTKWNVYRLAESGAAEPMPMIRSVAIDVAGWLSPSGRWLAYMTDEAGRLDLYVQPYPNGGDGQPISKGGVQGAWWGRDDHQLWLLKRDQTLWRVAVSLGADGASKIGQAEQVGAFPSTQIAVEYAPARDQFLALLPERSSVDAITIVQSWRGPH